MNAQQMKQQEWQQIEMMKITRPKLQVNDVVTVSEFFSAHRQIVDYTSVVFAGDKPYKVAKITRLGGGKSFNLYLVNGDVHKEIEPNTCLWLIY